MNNWGGGGDQFHMMPMRQQMMQPPPNHQQQPLIPPPLMAMHTNPAPAVNKPPDKVSQPLIGPVLADNFCTIDMTMSDDDNDANDAQESEKNNSEREARKDKGFKNIRDRGRGQDPGGMRRFNRNDRFDRQVRNDRGRDPYNRYDRDRRHSKLEGNDNSGLVELNLNRKTLLPLPKGPTMQMGPDGQMGPGGLMGPAGQMGPGGPIGSNSLLGPGPGMGPNMVSRGPGMGSGMGGLGMGMGSSGPMRPDGLGMMTPGMMQQYGMQNMSEYNMGNMMQGMNMPNMINNMTMNPNMSMPMFFTEAMLLPPVCGTSMPNRREKPSGCRTIFVGGLPKGVSEQTIQEIFSNFGDVSDIKIHRQGVCHVRFEKHESVEASFFISGYRFKLSDQGENEATTLFVDYALNREDQNEFERNKRFRQKTPPRIEMFSMIALTTMIDKIKSDDEFPNSAPTLLYWLERGECNKRNANTFYSLIQASNNHVRRLFNQKMTLDEEYHSMKSTLREKYEKVVVQFEQVAKILTVAKHQRVSDHFSKQQRRNVEMWLKMTEELENIKEELNTLFDDEEVEKAGRAEAVPLEKYEKLRKENESLTFELEGYKNEVFLVKDEAERKFEKFKAQYIAQQALLQNKKGNTYLSMPPPPLLNISTGSTAPSLRQESGSKPPPLAPDDDRVSTTGPGVPPTEARLISILTAFLLVHPLGASLDYLVSYVRSMIPQTTQATIEQILKKFTDVFVCKTSGVGANIESRWTYVTFDSIKTAQEG